MKKILVVLTNVYKFKKGKELTGLWLSEATEFVNEVSKAGYQVDYVSPAGGYVPTDPRSMKRSYLKDEDIKLYGTQSFKNKALANSLSPKEIDAKNYEAIYYTGGHGVMFDFPDNKELQEIAAGIYRNNGYVMSVCHGIAGLLNIKINDKYLIANKRITGFTTSEEVMSGKFNKVPFLNRREAIKRKAKFVKKFPFRKYVVIDGRIITGQNPSSAKLVAKTFLKIANKKED